MAVVAETNPGQTPNEIAEAYLNSSREHYRKQYVPLGAILLFAVFDNSIPKGFPSTVEGVAVAAYMLEWVRQGFLFVRDLGRAGKAVTSGSDNAPPIQSS
jgi:hypothetical protein